MLFIVCEHYYNPIEDNLIIDNTSIKDVEECFICLEKITTTGEKPFKYKNCCKYIKQCKCDGWIHGTCIEVWFNRNLKCPICKCVIIRTNDKIFSFIRENENLIRIYIKARNALETLTYKCNESIFFLLNSLYLILVYYFCICISLRVLDHYFDFDFSSYKELKSEQFYY